MEGGHLVIARALVGALEGIGHKASLVVTPSLPFGRQFTEYRAAWSTNVRRIDGRNVDMVISTRYPSYAVRHPRHVCWLNHTMREYYDLWDRFAGGLSPQGRIKELGRRTLIRAADSHFFFWHVQHLYAQSQTIQARLRRWNHARADVLYPPPPPRDYRCDGYEPYLFVYSRLTALKRIDLVLDALARPAAGQVRAVIAGEGEAGDALRARARALGLDSRVTFIGRISDATLVDHLARCRAVAFVPLQEDYGFVTAEAFASAKPVVTVTDSGGPAELVRDGLNGCVVDPDADHVAVAIGAVMESAAGAERLGLAGLEVARGLHWSDVARTLTALV